MQKTASITLKKTIAIGIFIGFVGVLFYYLSSILTPFAAAFLLAYLSNPLINRLIKLGLSRTVAACIVFFLLFSTLVLLILLLLPFLQMQLIKLINFIPDALAWGENKVLPILAKYTDTQITDGADVKKLLANNLAQVKNVASVILYTTLQSGRAFFELIITLILIPVVTFYLMRDWDYLLTTLKKLLPPNSRPHIIKIAQECDSVLSAFFRGQLLVMLCLAIYYAIGLTIIGISSGIGIGLITGILGIVPYLGFVLGFTIAIIASLMQFGTWDAISLVILIFLIGNVLENMLLTPVLIGDRIGLHPVAVIFALLAGGALFGFFGVLLALPVAAVIMVLLRHLNRRYQSSVIYKS